MSSGTFNGIVPINDDGRVPVDATIQPGVTAIPVVFFTGGEKTTFNSVSTVPAGVLTSVVTYTAGATDSLQKVCASGTNMARYELFINGVLVDNQYSSLTQFSVVFDFLPGIPLVSGQLVELKVIHNRPYTGDFNGRIQVTS